MTWGLEDMANKAGDRRFLFAVSRLHHDFDARASLTVGVAPGAYPRTRSNQLTRRSVIG